MLIAVIALLVFGAAVAGMLAEPEFQAAAAPPAQSQAAQTRAHPPASMPNYNLLPPSETANDRRLDTVAGRNANTAPAPAPQAKIAPSPSAAGRIEPGTGEHAALQTGAVADGTG